MDPPDTRVIRQWLCPPCQESYGEKEGDLNKNAKEAGENGDLTKAKSQDKSKHAYIKQYGNVIIETPRESR